MIECVLDFYVLMTCWSSSHSRDHKVEKELKKRFKVKRVFTLLVDNRVISIPGKGNSFFFLHFDPVYIWYIYIKVQGPGGFLEELHIQR